MMDNHTALIEKPHNIEAEQALLASILLSEEAYASVTAAGLLPIHFYRQGHQVILGAITTSRKDGQGVDPVTLCDRLRNNEMLDKVGGRQYILDLSDHLPSAANAMHYARIVMDAWVKREVIDKLQKLILAAQEPKSAEDLLAKVDTNLRKLRHPASTSIPSHLDCMNELLDSIDSGQEADLLYTGFHELDNLLFGIPTKTVTVIGANPGAGKSAFILQVAIAAHRKRSWSGIISIEMDRMQIAERIAASEAGIPIASLRKKDLSIDEHSALSRAIARLPQEPLPIDDRGDVTADNIGPRIRHLVQQYGSKNVFVDYLQYVAKAKEARRLEIDDIIDTCKEIAKEIDIRIVVVSALTRVEPTASGSKSTRLGNLKESSGIDYSADIILILDRDPVAQQPATVVHVKKWRQGNTGRCTIYYNGPRLKFYDTAKECADSVGFAIRMTQL